MSELVWFWFSLGAFAAGLFVGRIWGWDSGWRDAWRIHDRYAPGGEATDE